MRSRCQDRMKSARDLLERMNVNDTVVGNRCDQGELLDHNGGLAPVKGEKGEGLDRKRLRPHFGTDKFSSCWF